MKRIKIATHPGWLPDSGECSVDGFERRKNCRPGYGPEILDFVLRYIKQPYEIVVLSRSADQGAIIDRNNSVHVYNGIMGDIQQGTYDTVAAIFTINSERYETFDFTTPIFPVESMFVVGPHEPSWNESSRKLFTIFHPILTAAVLLSLGVIFLGLFATQSQERERKDINSWNDNITNKLEQLLVDASKQRLLTGKVLILLFGGILVLFPKLYESVILTLLLLPPDPVRMTEKQLLDRVFRKELTFVIDENEYNTFGHWEIIRYSKEEKFRKFQEALRENPPFFFNGDKTTLVKIFEENPTKYVYIGDADYADWLKSIDSGCQLRSIKMEDPMVFWAGFLFRKNSTWVKKLNEGIDRNLRYIDGVYEQYNKQNYTKLCSNVDAHAIKPLGFDIVLGCFTWLLCGFIVSLLFLIFELFYNRRKKNKKTLSFIFRSMRTSLSFTGPRKDAIEFDDINFSGAHRLNLTNQSFRTK